MIPLLRIVSVPHWKQHPLRTFLTVVGIALGVGSVVAVAIVNRTLVGSFERTVNLIAGRAVLQVLNEESGLSESLWLGIRATGGVREAAPTVEGFLPVVGFSGERLLIYGVELLADRNIRDYQFIGPSSTFETARLFLTEPDSIALTESFSHRRGLGLGSRIALMTARGIREFTVRALLKERGVAKVFGGRFAVMDLATAQSALGKTGKLDVVHLTLQEGADVDRVRERIEGKLAGAATVESPEHRGAQIEHLLTSYRVGLFFVSLISLLVGFLLIYNAVSISVMQRRREIGTLRCLGLERSRVVGLFVCEAALYAVLGSLSGVLLGALFARAAVLVVGETVGNLFLELDMARTGLAVPDVALGLAAGMSVAVAAGFYPARQASLWSPLDGIRRGSFIPPQQRVQRISFFGVVLVLTGLLLWGTSLPELSPYAGFVAGLVATLIFLLGLCCLAPGFVVLFAAVLGGVVRRGSSVVGRIGLDHLARTPLRSGMTVGTLMVSLASILAIAVFIHSVRLSLVSWVDQMVTADLVVTSGAKTAGPRTVPIHESLGESLAKIAGVETVDYYRLIRSRHRGKPVLIESFSAKASSRLRSLPLLAGASRNPLESMARGEGVFVSESFQAKFGMGAGDSLLLATPTGEHRFEILGVYIDYSSDGGSVLLDRSLYKRLWRDSLVDAFDLWLVPGTAPETVLEQIQDAHGMDYQLFVSTHGDLKREVVGLMEQSFNVNYAVLVVAMIVSVLSLTNTLLASVLDRSREIGVLRAIGATRWQVRWVFIAEGGWMGGLGSFLGLVAGSIVSYHHVVYNTKVLTGWTFQYHYPSGLAALSLLAGVILCVLAAAIPALRATAARPSHTLAYE